MSKKNVSAVSTLIASVKAGKACEIFTFVGHDFKTGAELECKGIAYKVGLEMHARQAKTSLKPGFYEFTLVDKTSKAGNAYKAVSIEGQQVFAPNEADMPADYVDCRAAASKDGKKPVKAAPRCLGSR
jgi:hypothetical protein